MKRFGCSYIFFPFVFVIFGLTFVFAGRSLAPDANAAARAFENDPSCSAAMPEDVRDGACDTVPVSVVGAAIKITGQQKSPIKTPFVYLRFADGTSENVQLDGRAGDVFVEFYREGTPGRAQRFRGTIVRVAAGKDMAETTDAPDVNAQAASEMPIVGTIGIVLALLIVGLRIAYLRSLQRGAGGK